MIPQNDPPGYPGDEVVRKMFGQTVKKARLECGLTIEQAEILLKEAFAPNVNHSRTVRFGRTLGIVVRRIRESKGMTRTQLAGNSGLPLRFIISVERGKVASGGDLCQLVRLACGLKYPVGRFFEELTDLNEALRWMHCENYPHNV
jgi:DNA-binding XRE family transcriptional regulator